MLNSEYLVIKWEWLEDSLEDRELEQFYEFLERASFDKEEEKYYIVNTKEPFANEVLEILKRKGYREPKKFVKLSKGKLLDKLAELSKLEDKELAHNEAVEALIDYINDENITDAYLNVPSYF